MPETPDDHVLPPGQLAAGHRCRTDDLAYPSVSDWYCDHRGRVPIQAAAGLERYMRQHGCTFAAAFTALTGRGGPITLLEEEPARRPARRPGHHGDDRPSKG